MFVSVIIPTFNRIEVLKKCLEAITNQTIGKNNYEIIVVDDCSQDDTQKYCENFAQKKSNLVYLRNQVNEGRVVTRNKGIKKATGDLLVFLDNDLIVEQDFLELHLHQHSNKCAEKIAVVSNVTYQPEVIATTNFGTFIQSRAIGYRSNRDMQEIDINNLPSNFFAGGGSSCLKNEVLKIGMFDENLKKYGSEDELFGYKLSMNGVKIIFCEDAKIIHHDRNILPRYWKTKFIEQGRYGLRTILENEKDMIDQSMFKFLIPINRVKDNFKTQIIKKTVSIASNRVFFYPVEKFVFKTDAYKIFYFPILYRYLTMAWVLSGFKYDKEIAEVTY